MINDRRPFPRRHLGPAIQWAKPRSSGNRAGSSDVQKFDIEVDLTGELDNDSASISTPESESPSEEIRRSSHTDRAQEPTNEQVSQAIEIGGATATAKQWLPSNNSDQSSVWDYYSRSTEQNDAGSVQGRGYRSLYEDRNSQNVGYEYDHYFGDMTSPQDTSQQNRPSWDADRSGANVPSPAAWSQYVLPFLVVGLIVFLAFLTLAL